MVAPVNRDLPLSWKIPGVYTDIDFTGSGASSGDDSKRVLLLGYRTSSGSYASDTPVLSNEQSTVNSYFGTGSDVARLFAAEQSQNGPGVADVYCCGILEPSSGTAATYTMTFAGTATAAGSLDIFVCGYRASVSIANGDTATIVATAAYAELALLTDLPVTWADDGNGTLTATYRHKGVIGNDLPIRVDQTDGTGITVSPGTVTCTSSPSGTGAISLVVGATTITSAIDNAVQTTATLAGTKLATDINAGAYPVTAVDAGSGVVTLIYAKGRTVRRISVSDTVATMTTAVSLHGTSGAGSPTLTTAITNIENMSIGFSAIVSAFTDATAVDVIYDSVLVQENGINQKPPMVFLGAPDALATAGAIITAASPDLTASPRFALNWCRESPQQGHEIAARCAAIYVESDFGPRNFDGAALKTRGNVPLLSPAINDLPSQADQNSAIRTYYMTPIVTNSRDEIVILRGVTTSNAENADLREWSTIRQTDLARASLNARLRSLFSGKAYRTSAPKTPNTVTTTSVKDAIYVWIRELDDADAFDDAAAWKDAIRVDVNQSDRTRFNVYVPLALIRPLHQLGVVLGPQ